MEKTTTSLIVIFISLFFLVTAADPALADETDNIIKDEQIIADPYPKEVQDAFMSSCTENGGPEIICRCVVYNMPLQISLETLANGTNVDTILVEITNECVAKYIQN